MLDAGDRGVDPELGMFGWLVWSIDAREVCDLSRACARVQTLWVPPLAFLDGGVDEHLDEREGGVSWTPRRCAR